MELPKLSTGEIVGGALAISGIAAVGTVAAIAYHRKKSRNRKTSHNKSIRKTSRRGKGRKLKFGSKAYRRKYLNHGRRTPHTAGKRKDKSHRRIRYTSRGQPYVIGAHGKARFISRKSAKSSYKRKGGRY